MELSEAQARRAKKWEEEFIACKNHPERRCSRWGFIYNRARRCTRCKNGISDSTRTSQQHYWKQISRRSHRRIQQGAI